MAFYRSLLSAACFFGLSHPQGFVREPQGHVNRDMRCNGLFCHLLFPLLAPFFFTALCLPSAHAENSMVSDAPVNFVPGKNKISPNLERLLKRGRPSHTVRVIIRLKGTQTEDHYPGRQDFFPPPSMAQKIKEFKNRSRHKKRDLIRLLKHMKMTRREMPPMGRSQDSPRGSHIGDGIRSYWISNCIVATVTPDELERLAENPDVNEILENVILSVPPVDAEESFSEAELDLWNHNAIGLHEIAELGLRGTGVRVGHLDTGIEPDHPELEGKLTAWAEFGRYGEKLDSQPHESHYMAHGTHTASIIAGETVGVAPGVSLLSALVLPGGGGTLEQVLAGMQWVLDPDEDPDTDDGAQIVNMSWGMWGTSSVLDEAIDNMTAAGVLPVSAIGNTGPGTTLCPGNTEGSIGVGAVQMWDYVPWFTGGGWACWDASCLLKPDMVAPGVQVPGMGPGGEYQTMSGTSVAAPHVAGAAALLLEFRPGLTPQQQKGFLFNTSHDLNEQGLDLRTGHGRLDVSRALDFLDMYDSRLGTADLVLEFLEDTNSNTPQRFYTFFSDGESIQYGEQRETSPSFEVLPIGMADVSGDGFSDLIVRHTETLGIASYRIVYSVYLSIATAGLSPAPETWYAFVSDNPDPPEWISLSDVNGDGKSDLVYCQWEETTNGKWGHVRACLSTGHAFQEDPIEEDWATFYVRDSIETQLILGDVNGDAKSDLILSMRNLMFFYTPLSFSVALSDGSQFVTPFVYWLSAFPKRGLDPLYPLGVSDVNGDGFGDLVLGLESNDFQRSILIYVYLSDGFGRFLTERLWATVPTGEKGRVECLADVNGDGASDLIAYSESNEAGSFRAWLSNGRDQFLENPNPWFELEDIFPGGEVHFVGAANVGLGNWCVNE